VLADGIRKSERRGRRRVYAGRMFFGPSTSACSASFHQDFAARMVLQIERGASRRLCEQVLGKIGGHARPGPSKFVGLAHSPGGGFFGCETSDRCDGRRSRPHKSGHAWRRHKAEGTVARLPAFQVENLDEGAERAEDGECAVGSGGDRA